MSGRVALLLALAAAGCQDREVVGSVAGKGVLVLAARGALITVTAEEDPVLAGVWLRIPPGSLPHDLEIRIERGGRNLAGAATLPAGPAVIVQPAGTTLAIPARLRLPVTPGTPTDRLFIEEEDSDGRRARLASTLRPDSGTAEADIDRLVAFQVLRVDPGAAADAGLPPPPPPPPAP